MSPMTKVFGFNIFFLKANRFSERGQQIKRYVLICLQVSVDLGSRGLGYWKYEYICNVDRIGSADNKVDQIGDVFCEKGLEAFVDIVCPVEVSFETHLRKFGIDQSWVDA